MPSGTDSHTHNTHSDTCDTKDEVPQEPAPGVSCCGHHVSTWARGSVSGESGGLTAQTSPSFSVSLSYCPLKDIIGQTRTYVCHPCPPTPASWFGDPSPEPQNLERFREGERKRERKVERERIRWRGSDGGSVPLSLNWKSRSMETWPLGSDLGQRQSTWRDNHRQTESQSHGQRYSEKQSRARESDEETFLTRESERPFWRDLETQGLGAEVHSDAEL